MTIALAGSTRNIFRPFPGGVAEVTTAGTIDTAWVDCGIRIGNTNNMVRTESFSALTEGYIHFEGFLDSADSWARLLLEAGNDAGQGFIRLEDQRLRIWDGSVWQDRGDVIATRSGRVRWDIYFRAGVSGEVTVWRDEELVATWSGDTSLVSIENLLFGNPVSSGAQVSVISQVLVADSPTLRSKVSSRRPDNNGTYTAWTGDVTALDEAVSDFADQIVTSSTSDRESFTCSARSFTGYQPLGVGVTLMGYRAGASSPKIRTFLRRSGVDYDGTDITLDFGRSRHRELWETDPSTGTAWTAEAAQDATLEFGVQGRP